MPDLLLVFNRRWPLLLFLTLAGTAVALIVSLASPKLYLGSTTALPVNAALSDKAHISNSNIEALYAEIGGGYELDKLEGTARLDTLFLAVAARRHLAAHYNLDTTGTNSVDQAALLLRRASDIKRTSYGEFNVKVWDRNPAMAATLANDLLQTINAIHERLQTENNNAVLQKLKEVYAKKLREHAENEERVLQVESPSTVQPDTGQGLRVSISDFMFQQTALTNELKEYKRLIGDYELAVQTTPKSLLVVEQARPAYLPDRPKTVRNLLLAFLASFSFACLLAVYFESRTAA